MDKIGFGKDMFMNRTSKLLSKVLDFRVARQNVISGNLANAETPGFIQKELPFEQELQRAYDKTGMVQKKTNPKHFSSSEVIMDKGFSPNTLIRDNGNPNELNIDQEMAKMAQNNLLYEASAKLLSKKFQALKSVISETGR